MGSWPPEDAKTDLGHHPIKDALVAATSVPYPRRPERSLSLSPTLQAVARSLSLSPPCRRATDRAILLLGCALPLYAFQALKPMLKAKRSGGHITRSFHKNRRACKTDWVSGHLYDDCNQDVFTKLSERVKSDFCKSVVSISLCNGDIALFSCSGIAIARQRPNLTRFLTSASLVTAFDGKTNEHYYGLKIEVRHEGKMYMGFLDEHDLDRNFAVVNVRSFLNVHVGIFDSVLEFPYGEAEACVVGRDVSGDLMARSVELGGEISENDKDLDSKISKAWDGGAVFSFGGEFVGMSLFLVMGRVVFLPWSTIVKHLECYWTSWGKETGLACTRVYGFGARVGGKSNSYPEAHRDLRSQEQLDLDGYPKLPSMGGAWKKLSGKAASSIGRNVVALASFNGEKRFFACSGFFIRWNGSTIILTSASLIRNSGDENNIAENLRIEVMFPGSKKRIDGMLEHYNLHYNVALVSVKDRYCRRPANTLFSWSMCHEVAAVGCCFKSGTLMAASGILVCSTGTLDCGQLACSSCKIKKLGIGGPLVTMDGDVLGMNFYDTKIGTPFLLWYDIYDILKSFEGESKADPLWKMDRDVSDKFNRWPVPMPCWHRPDDDDDDDDGKYAYFDGEKVIYADFMFTTAKS